MDELEEVEEGEEELTTRFWDDPTHWPSGSIPKEDDIVEIMSGWNMVYNLKEPSPIFKKIEINGKLTFTDDHDTHLRSKIIFVRAGSLEIGNETVPHKSKAEITLIGKQWDEALAISNDIFAGSKVLANIGTLKLYGTSRGGSFTRLMHPVDRTTKKFRVERGLDI
mmetsp:Transcript_41647/g.63630  ORF Transcript_41647/g.63630 Transcript_41647/m.63630 type:complete len:166 (-) Transcript_41647:2455-2952(-)